MIFYRVVSMGHFQSFERTIKDAQLKAAECKESLELLDIDPDDPELGVEITKMDIPTDKHQLHEWLNQNYAC